MLRFTKVTFLTALALLAAFPPAVADSSEEAEAWLEKMTTVFHKGGFSVDQSVQLRVSQGGAPTEVDVVGDLVYGGPGRMRSDVTITVKAPQMGENAMTMNVLTVSDGEIQWTEMDNPALGGKVVTKQLAETADGAGSGFNTTSTDPIAQIRGMVELLDFEVASTEGGAVTLEAAVNDAFLQSLGPAAQAFKADRDWRLHLILDQATAFPQELRFGDPAAPAMVAAFSNYRNLGDEASAGRAFSYTPPEGLPVRDLTQAPKTAPAPPG